MRRNEIGAGTKIRLPGLFPARLKPWPSRAHQQESGLQIPIPGGGAFSVDAERNPSTP
jgi:hypothetical protein